MAAQRTYTLVFAGLTGLTAVPFLQLATPATTGIELLAVEITQEASATSAQAVMSIMRRTTASTLPTATAPLALNQNDPPSLLTSSTTTNAVGVATVNGTAGNVLVRLGFNVLNGLFWYPVPEQRITVAPSSFLTLQFPTAPAADTWSGQVYFRELE